MHGNARVTAEGKAPTDEVRVQNLLHIVADAFHRHDLSYFLSVPLSSSKVPKSHYVLLLPRYKSPLCRTKERGFHLGACKRTHVHSRDVCVYQCDEIKAAVEA